VTGNYVLLTENQRLELSRIAQSRSLPAGYVFRARLILLLAEGASYHSIKLRLETAAPPHGAGGPQSSGHRPRR
jgi:hypothetical protein